jgi:hypothetical protein
VSKDAPASEVPSVSKSLWPLMVQPISSRPCRIAKSKCLREVPMSGKCFWAWNCYSHQCVEAANFTLRQTEVDMGFGRGVLFWLLGIPIPIIILLALFWHQ